jgi:hypothetical protein
VQEHVQPRQQSRRRDESGIDRTEEKPASGYMRLQGHRYQPRNHPRRQYRASQQKHHEQHHAYLAQNKRLRIVPHISSLQDFQILKGV